MEDCLNRDEYINSIDSIIKQLISTNSNCCFAIDGKWGSGKTYIIKALEKKYNDCNDNSNNNKYNVFYYDCWKYDYYEEPLIAIIASMYDCIYNNPKILKDTKSALNDIKNIALDLVNGIIKNKYGVDVLSSLYRSDIQNKSKEQEIHAYDDNYGLKNSIDLIRRKISKIAAETPIIIFVDEIDRCQPQYAITVLERLHHIFYGLENVIIILSIDVNQLEKSIKEIFGLESDTDKYLRKIINFKIPLDNGDISDLIFNKFSEYTDGFANKDEMNSFII